MNRLLLLAFAVCSGISSLASHAAETRPNILFIIVDEFGWRDLSCYGSSFYQTVNMDRLAREGVRFTQAYAAHSRCLPSRYAIMSGKYPARVRGDEIKMRAPDVSLCKAFKEAGYATWYAGKWHLGTEDNLIAEQGFTQSVAMGGYTLSHYAPYNGSRKTKSKIEKAIFRGLTDAPAGEYLTDRLTDETIRFIRRFKDKPFFAVLSHYALYPPFEAKPGYVQRYRKKLEENPPGGSAWETEHARKNKLQQDSPIYAAMIHSVDEGIGRILDLLSEFKIADRTIVVLTSDHGGFSAPCDEHTDPVTSNRPLRAGKWHLYEGGIRVPLIVKWPGVSRPGFKCDLPVIGTDLYPTFLEMAGLPLRPEQHLDGQSFVPLLKGATKVADRALFWHNPAPRSVVGPEILSSAIRCGNYKLVDFYAEHCTELYDLSTDIGEHKDLMKSLPEKGAELKGKLDAWRKELQPWMPATLADLSPKKAKTPAK